MRLPLLVTAVIAACWSADLRADEARNALPSDAIMQLGSSYLTVGDDVHAVTFSPDGRLMAALFEDRSSSGQVRIWDTATGKRLRDIGVPRLSKMLQFSADGKSLFTLAKRFSVTGDEEELPKPNPSHFLVALEGNTAAFRTNTNGELLLFDLAAKKQLSRFKIELKSNGIQSAHISPDEKTIAVGTYDGQLQLRSVASGELLSNLVLPQKTMVAVVRFSPDGKLLAAGGFLQSLPIYNVATGKMVQRFVADNSRIGALQAIEFMPDGKRLVAGSRYNGVVRFWDLQTGRAGDSIETSLREINSLAVSADSQHLVVGGESSSGGTRINLWNLASRRRMFVPSGPKTMISTIAYAPNTGRIATGASGGQIHLWDARSGKMLLELAGDATSALAFSSDSWLLGAANRRGAYKLWETDTGDNLVTRTAEVTRRATCSAFAPEMDRVVLGREDGRVEILDVATGKQLKAFQTYTNAPVRCATFSSDGKWFATAAGRSRSPRTSNKDTLEIWNAETGELDKKLEVPLIVDARYSSDGVISIEFSPDGSLVAGSHYRGGTFIWDLKSRAVIQQLPRGLFRFSSDGKLIAHVEGSRVELRELATGGTLVHRMIPLSNVANQIRRPGVVRNPADPFGSRSSSARRVSALAFSPDGSSFATAMTPKNTVMIWGLTPRGWNERVGDEPLSDDEFRRNWSILADVEAAPAYRAIWSLVAGGSETVSRIAPKLAAAGQDKKVEKEQILNWIAGLDAEDFREREEAARQLRHVGAPAVSHLQAASNRSSKEAAFRIERLLKIIERPVQRLSGEPLRRIRAIQVLEKIGTREATTVLEKVAVGDPDARETRDAVSALTRVKTRNSGR